MPTRVDKLTKEQEARMPEWRDKWIAIGLRTGEADWQEFEKQVKVAYAKTNLPVPKTIVRVQSPIVGAFAAPLADAIIRKLNNKDDAVGGAVRDAVRDAVDGAVGGAVGDAVDDAVGDAVGGAVGSAIKNLQWYNLLGGQFWVGWYWGSPSYVSFFTEVCDLELSADIAERANCYQQIAKSVCWWWPYRDFIMVCNRPSAINRDANGQLHSEIGKAIEWPDGWGFHVLHGIRFDKNPELWQKIVSGRLTAKELTEITDVDQRRIAMTYLKGDDFVTQMKAILVNTGKMERFVETDNETISYHYKLYKIKKGDIYAEDKYFLMYPNASTGETHMKFVSKWVRDLGEDADAVIAATHNTDKKSFARGWSA